MSQSLSNAEQRRARILAIQAQSGSLRHEEAVKLADYMLRALDQIRTLAAVADPMAARFATGSAGPHRYPELIAVGLDHLWVGPGFNDFAPALIEACRKHLKTLNLPAQKGHALDYIRNRIREQNWGALEQRWFEGLPRAAGATPAPQPQAETAAPPPFGTPEYWAWDEKRRGGGK